MEHTMFLTQILGCVSAALVVALIWEHSRLRSLERRADEIEDAVGLHTDSLVAMIRRLGE